MEAAFHWKESGPRGPEVVTTIFLVKSTSFFQLLDTQKSTQRCQIAQIAVFPSIFARMEERHPEQPAKG
jgi:hypothetical protein